MFHLPQWRKGSHMPNIDQSQNRCSSSNLRRSSGISKWLGWETGLHYTSLGNVQIGEQEDVRNMINIHWKRILCRFRNRDDNWRKYRWRRKFLSGKNWRIYQTRRSLLYNWDIDLQRQHRFCKVTNNLYTTNCTLVDIKRKKKKTIKSILVQVELFKTKVPEGQVLIHFPFDKKVPAKQPVHWARFIVEALL